MKTQRAYKTKLKLNNRQRSCLRGCAGLARVVYNLGVAEWREMRREFAKRVAEIMRDSEYDDDTISEAHKIAFDRRRTKSGGFESVHHAQKRRFNAVKYDLYPWVKEYPYKVVESAFDNLGKAYKKYAEARKDPAFMREVEKAKERGNYYYGQPQFKSKHDDKSFTLRAIGFAESDSIDLKNKIGRVRLAERDYLPKETKFNSATISERGGEWWISVQCEVEIADPEQPTGAPIGVDLGVKEMAVVSDGKRFDNPRALRKYEKRLARLQRELSRRKKFSANWKKTKAKISQMHLKIANIRNHHQHQISAYVARDADARAVVIENLNVKGMMAKAKPKPSERGDGYERNGRAAKSGLSKSVADSGMGETARQIRYKCEWYGPEVKEADRFFASSKIHAKCGYYNAGLKLSDRRWWCPDCEEWVDRDGNASENLAGVADQCP